MNLMLDKLPSYAKTLCCHTYPANKETHKMQACSDCNGVLVLPSYQRRQL